MFFAYLKFMTAKNREYNDVMEKAKKKRDSADFVSRKVQQLNEEVKKHDADFLIQVQGTFVWDILNLKSEKLPDSIPTAANGRPDSIYQYCYYKDHFFDGVNFKDERLVYTPFFDGRIKKFFDNVLLMHPDTVIFEIDKILAKCEENSEAYNLLIGYFTYKYEQSKLMGFDKVFVHMADKYIISGKAKKVYADETVKIIKDRVDILRNLLLGVKVPDLYVVDTADAVIVRNMGFDTASSGKSITDLYYKKERQLAGIFKTLHSVAAKYTVLVFWAADCGHCQAEIPKLHADILSLNKTTDVKVFAVQTKEELYASWKKFICDKKLTGFTHVYDPVHINNYKDRFDVYSVPVIYLLDKDKKILAKRLGAEQVSAFIKSLEGIRDSADTGN